MNTVLKLMIDGKEVEAREGQTILEVVREKKLNPIPTLCYDPLLPPYGSCYLCVVEVEGFTKLLPSCVTPVHDGMVVRTDTPAVHESRKMALELLLSNHYADCVAPCSLACPAGVDVQGYIALASMGRFGEAVERIRERNPLPIVCSRVCVRHCEVKGCRRARVDEQVGINNIKRYVADFEMETHVPPPLPPSTGKRVAVVGGGPAGLTCAYYLRMKGHTVTLLEQLPKLGGMLRYGIPEYRLPRKILDREIDFITKEIGVEVHTGKSLGRDFTVSSLKKEGYDAIFLALGAMSSKAMGIEGEFDTKGVKRGLDFLMSQELEGHQPLRGKVVVIGGGNTAVDVARTALRLGASEVVILYRRTRNEMPADPIEVHDAEKEGVKMEFLAAPVKLEKDTAGNLRGITCIRMELGEPDSSGRRRPIPVKESEYFLPADIIFSAIGQEPFLECLEGDPDAIVETTKWKTIAVDEETFETSAAGVFAGGDVVSGPDVVIGAIAHGRKAAESIHGYLMTGKAKGQGRESGKGFTSKKDFYGEIPEKEWEGIKKAPRQLPRERHVAERIKTFDEVTLGLTEESLAEETMRCLECGCEAYLSCELRKLADKYGVTIPRFKGEVKRMQVDDRHPFIRIDNNKCILCGRCIRTCSDVLGITALGFVNRGFKTEVHPAMKKPLQETTCISCGSCVDACPTGAIVSRPPASKKVLALPTKKVTTTCHQCSVGCRMNVEVAARSGLFWISTDRSADPDGLALTAGKGYLCIKGRYNVHYMMDGEKPTSPLVKEGNKFKETSWSEAIRCARERLAEVASRYGAESVAVFGAPYRTNEELYLIQKLARYTFGTDNVSSFVQLASVGGAADALEEAMGVAASTATLTDLEKADVVFLLGDDLDEEGFVAGVVARMAVHKGARLIDATYHIREGWRPIDRVAALRLAPRKGGVATLLWGVGASLLRAGMIDEEFVLQKTSGFDQWKSVVEAASSQKVSEMTGVAAEAIEKAASWIGKHGARVVAVYIAGSGVAKRGEGRENVGVEVRALVNLMLLTGKVDGQGSGIILLEACGNAQGARDMGLSPGRLPGGIRSRTSEAISKLSNTWGKHLVLKGASNNADLLGLLEAGKIKGMLVFGEDPFGEDALRQLCEKVETVVVLDSSLTATAQAADIFLPIPTMVETEGTMTNCERRIQRVGKAFEPACGKEGWEIIAAMMGDGAVAPPSKGVQWIWEEITSVCPSYAEVEGSNLNFPVPVRWTLSGGAPVGGLYGGVFRTPDGKARFLPIEVPLSTSPPSLPLPGLPHLRAYAKLREHYLPETSSK